MNGALPSLSGAPAASDSSPSLQNDPETVLAFDYGARRIGVAVGNSLTGTATPLVTAAAYDGGPDWAAIDALVRQWSPGTLIVGMPVAPDEGRHPLADAVERFAAELRRRHGLPVYTVDERLTSAAAEAELREGRAKGARRIRRGDIDRAAAALIAETWLSGGGGHG